MFLSVKKLHCFTLWEVMISLLLSVLIFSLAGLIFFKIFTLEKRVRLLKNQVNEIEFFYHLLTKDFYDAHLLIKGECNQLLCIKDKDSIVYKLDKLIIIRKQSVFCDTFDLNMDSVNFLFKKQIITVNRNVVDELHLSLILPNKKNSLPVYFKKNYGADIYIENRLKLNYD